MPNYPSKQHTVKREERTEGAERWVSFEQWKADQLNLMFKNQGVTGEYGNITAKTVRHGELAPAAVNVSGFVGEGSTPGENTDV